MYVGKGNSILKSGDGLHKQIDDACGKTKDDLLTFIKLVEKTIFEPLKNGYQVQ